MCLVAWSKRDHPSSAECWGQETWCIQVMKTLSGFHWVLPMSELQNRSSLALLTLQQWGNEALSGEGNASCPNSETKSFVASRKKKGAKCGLWRASERSVCRENRMGHGTRSGRKTWENWGWVCKKTQEAISAGTWGERTGTAKAGFVLQPHSGSHCQDTARSEHVPLNMSLGTRSLALATAERCGQTPPQIPVSWPALLSHHSRQSPCLQDSTAPWSSAPSHGGPGPCVHPHPAANRILLPASGARCCTAGLAWFLPPPGPLRSWPSCSCWCLDV